MEKHVIVEKPMTANERQAEELYCPCKEAGSIFIEAITTRSVELSVYQRAVTDDWQN